MQRFRKSVLGVSLGLAIIFGAAGAVSSPTTVQRHRNLDDGIITRILQFFGIEPQSRVSIPPG